jgi:O-antigen ligase
MFFGITAPFSPFQLLFSLIALAIFFRKRAKIGVLMSLFIFALLCYLVVGVFSYGLNYFEDINDIGIYKPIRDVITSLIITVVFYLLFRKYKAEGKHIRKLSFILFCGMTSVLLTIFGMAIGLYDDIEGVNMALIEQRSMGVFANPNQAGIQANLTLTVILFLFLTNTKHKWILIALIPFVIFASFRTFSKGAMVSTLFVLIAFITILITRARYLNARSRNGVLIMVSVLVGLSIYVAINIETFIQNYDINQLERVFAIYEIIIEGKIDAETTSSRNELVAHGLGLVQERPLFGNGLGSFHKFAEPGLTHGSHNQYLNILGESGFLPLLLLFSCYGLAMWRGYVSGSTAIRFFIWTVIGLMFLNGMVTHTLLREKSVIAMLGITFALVERVNLRWA